jgi:hypothetical protein
MEAAAGRFVRRPDALAALTATNRNHGVSLPARSQEPWPALLEQAVEQVQFGLWPDL